MEIEMSAAAASCPSMLGKVNQHQWTNDKKQPYERMCKYNNRIAIDVQQKYKLIFM